LVVVAAAALLIWVRLRIVAQVPRSVLAEPSHQPVVNTSTADNGGR
jgi:hypothetical protein